MIQYIPKDAVVAEIEKLKVHSEEAIREFGREGYMDNVLFEQSKIRICETLLSSLNTLEVKEVDLEKEIEQYVSGKGLRDYGFLIPSIAKHFFELGLKASK